jgi:hypothetical protein
MSNIDSYEQLIYNAIASSLGLKSGSLRIPPTLFPVPQDDRTLFNLFDLIPDSPPVFEPNKNTPHFSRLYEEILNSSPPSMLTTMARNNFVNPNNWLPADNRSGMSATPKYTPTCHNISSNLANGAAFNYSLDSSALPQPASQLYPSFPNFFINQPFKELNNLAEKRRFIFTLHFDKIIAPNINTGAWYTSGFFTHAYKSQGTGWLTGPGTVTWDSLFGQHGVLKYVFNNTIIVAGISATLKLFGPYDDATLQALKNNPVTSIWPFYIDVSNMTQDYALDGHGNITITTHTPPSAALILAMAAASVSDLMGGASA